MIHITTTIPRSVFIAFSGGVDSLSAAHFLARGGREITLLHFNHGCEYSGEIQARCLDAAEALKLPIVVGTIPNPTPPAGASLEAYWRDERYKFLHTHASLQRKVITVHNLDDAVESWVWSALHGKPHLIKPEHGTVLRPFLLTAKSDLIAYAARNGLTPVDDPYNRENNLTRNYIRSNLLPHAYRVNPGLRKVIKKMYLSAKQA